MEVRSIPREQVVEWIEKKHYSRNMPPLTLFHYGLYDDDLMLQGVCIYGMPARLLNNGYSAFGGALDVQTYELTRLVINEPHPRNWLSYFVGRTIRYMPRHANECPKSPCTCSGVLLVSYADDKQGHHGYIYQATNWYYTGVSKSSSFFRNKATGELIHRRTLSGIMNNKVDVKNLPDYIEHVKEKGGKHRYLYFRGTNKQVEQMRVNLKYEILPYPKGDNKRYDASADVNVQAVLF